MEEYQFVIRKDLPLIPCIVCGKPDTTGYCFETCERIDIGTLRVVTIADVLGDNS